MTATFKRTALNSFQTMSERLRTAREQAGHSLDQCALETGIQKKYLRAIEESLYEQLPGDLYARSWIRKYAQHLNIDDSDLVATYERENKIRKEVVTIRKTKTQSPASSIWAILTMRRLVALALGIIIIGYLYNFLNRTISPPAVIFDPPLADYRTESNSTIIKGRTAPGVIISINNQQINLDASGEFSQEVTLRDGINTITITAHKQHSRNFVKEIRVVKVSQPQLPIATTTGP